MSAAMLNENDAEVLVLCLLCLAGGLLIGFLIGRARGAKQEMVEYKTGHTK
jgi:hypothetical protein